MKKILSLITVFIIIICALGCKNSTEAPTAKVANVPNNGVAVVNGLLVSTKDYQTYLHNNFGDKALTSLIQQKILESWAKEEGVTPTKEQINKEIQKLKDEGQYDMILEQIGETGINQLVMDQLLRTNISKKLYPPTEAELKEGYENFKAEYNHGPRKQVLLLISEEKSSLEEVLKATESVNNAIAFEKKIKELSKKYTGSKAIKNGTIWVAETDKNDGLPEDLVKAVKSMDVNAKSNIKELKGQGGSSMFYAFIVKKTEEKVEKSLADVKDDVTDKTALFNTITKPDFRDALQKKTESAKIEIKIEKFKDLADIITTPQPIPNMAEPQQVPQPSK